MVLGWDGLHTQTANSFAGQQLLADLLSIAGGLFFGLANVYLRKFESATAYERTMTMYLGSGVVPLGLLGLMALINLVVFQSSMQFPSLSSPLQAAPQAWLIVPLLALGLDLYCILAIGGGFEPVPKDIQDDVKQGQEKSTL